MFDGIIEWITSILSPVLTMPNSTLFVLAVAVSLNLITITTNRLFTDVNQLRNYEIEVRQHMNNLNAAKKRKDKQAIIKLERKEPRINRIQSIVAKQKMKTSLLLMFPFMAIFMSLNAIYGSSDPNFVAILPFEFPILLPKQLPFSTWYLICYFAVFSVFNRFFGVTFEMDEEPSKVKSQPKKIRKKKKRFR
ncbi:DUF106 domain-containing protein [Candidatus Bathyarchaeota archaeon]|nr:DUF106 domain-containing protein [Candidatus Bathyarchaeota archaeon]